MKYRAVLKKRGESWIGWLLDLPGVNAQERTRKALLKSLRIGVEDMFAADVPFEPGAEMIAIDMPDTVLASHH